MKIFTIYDSKTDAHVMMMNHDNEETMKRDVVQRLKGSQLETFAEDYTLFEIAAYDEVTGTITPYSAHRSICNLMAIFPKHGMSDDGDSGQQLSAIQ